MSAVAGWYTDPNGVAGQLRWWDGTQWTEHVTADPTSAADGAGDDGDSAATEPTVGDQHTVGDEATVTDAAGVTDEASGSTASTSAATSSVPPPPAAEDLLEPAVGGAGATGWGSGGEQTAWASTASATVTGGRPPPPSAPVWGSASGGTWAGAPAAPSWEPVPRASGNGVRVGLIVAAVVGVVLVGLVGLVFVGFVRSAGEFSVSVGADEGFHTLDGEVTFGGQLDPGGRVRADVPDGGSLELELPVDAPGNVVIDIRGAHGFDPVAELVDEFDEVVAYNDDRPGSTAGGGRLDPLLDTHLEPGTYRVFVRGFGGDAGTVDVSRS